MRIDLPGLSALVTGSTAGIGLATARRLAGTGARVIINGRTPSRVESALATLRAAVPGATVSGVVADVATAEGCQELVRATGSVDILVNNMGIFEPKPFFEIPDGRLVRRLRGQRHVRRPPRTRLHAGHAGA